jgi:ATP-binding cassette, subfamily B, bacterial
VRRNLQTLWRILPYLKPYWRLAILALVLTLLAALFSLLLPWPLAIMFDSVLGDNPLPPILEPMFGSLDRVTLLVLLAVGAVALTATQGMLGVLEEYVSTKIDQYMTLEFRSDLFQHAQRLSFAYHDQSRTGQFVAQINLQASSAGNLIVAIPPILQSIATLGGMLVIALSINVKLTLLVISVVPFIYYSTGYYVKRIEPRLIKVRGMEGESLSIVHEAMAMLRVVVPFGLESHQYERFREQGERAVDARVDLTVRQTVFSVVVNILTAIGTALVLGFGAYQILQGDLRSGRLLVMMSYTAAVYQPLEQMSATIGTLQEQFVNARGAFALRDAQVEIEDAPGAQEIERVAGDVTYEGVHFSYRRRVATLEDISFSARAGQRVAIVGPTGAGKTTLISLLPRFYDPARGRIMLDGTDIRKVTLKSLRQQISLVLQEPLLFSGSIAENILYGRLGASMEEVVEAAKDANAHDFIMRMPEKYETRLGERGALLSGGERQRISIARAFLKDAPICILDEPTSSIDSRTESVILDSLERLMVGRTTFMIAHRLSTVRDADIILVLNHGELVEQGTHDDLLERDSLYRQLHIAQTGQAQHKEGVERFERLELAVQETSTSTRQSNGRAQLGGTWETPPTAREAGVPDSTANDTVQRTPPDPPARASESPKVAHWRDGGTRTEELQGEPERAHQWRRQLYAIFVAIIIASVYLGRNLIF